MQVYWVRCRIGFTAALAALTIAVREIDTSTPNGSYLGDSIGYPPNHLTVVQVVRTHGRGTHEWVSR